MELSSMVHCEHCGRTDGCSYHDFHELTLCLRCYKAARDREFEERKRLGLPETDSRAPGESIARQSPQIRRLIDKLMRKE